MGMKLTSTLLQVGVILASFIVNGQSEFTHHGIKINENDTDKVLSSINPTVDVKQGTIQGKAELSRNGRVYLSFKGVPYGKIPQRFNDAVPADPWKGTLDGTKFGDECPQVEYFSKKVKGSEDCLSLNVFVPKIETKETLPVMLFIHGGGFSSGGSSIYTPSYFMDEDIILVTINYRLNAFGFLNAGVKGASGNQGLKDLVVGLKWIQENIGTFGGDLKRVTIFGQSAGGCAVSHLTVSPMAKDLFSGAIAQSGSVTATWSVVPDPEFEQAKKLAHSVDCPSSNREFMVECLRKIKVDVLTNAANYKDASWFDRFDHPLMSPGIEYYKESDDTVFLGENVENLFEQGKINKVPLLMGVVAQEGLSVHAGPVLTKPTNVKKINEQWGRVMPQSLLYQSIAKDPCKVSSKLKRLYFGEKTVGFDTASNLVSMYGNFAFDYPARHAGLRHAQFAPVYFYNFTYPVTRSIVEIFGWKFPPEQKTKYAVHGDEIQFQFSDIPIWSNIKKGSPDYEFSVNFIKLWTSFARTGKPTHLWGNVTTLHPVNVTDTKHDWINIDDGLTTVPETEEFLKQMGDMEDIFVNDLGLHPDK